MKQKLLHVIEMGWRERVRFVKYFIVGVTSTVIYLALVMICVEWFHLNPTLSVIINQAIVLGFNFTLNKKWSFGSTGASHKELIRYFILSTFNYLFSVGAMHIGNGVLGLPYLFVSIGTTACMVPWNFLLFRFWVYREKSEAKS